MSAQTQETPPVRRHTLCLGLFYFNREDRRTFVPKRLGYGWTFNFARPGTYAILLALNLIPIAIALLAR